MHKRRILFIPTCCPRCQGNEIWTCNWVNVIQVNVGYPHPNDPHGKVQEPPMTTHGFEQQVQPRDEDGFIKDNPTNEDIKSTVMSLAKLHSERKLPNNPPPGMSPRIGGPTVSTQFAPVLNLPPGVKQPPNQLPTIAELFPDTPKKSVVSPPTPEELSPESEAEKPSRSFAPPTPTLGALDPALRRSSRQGQPLPSLGQLGLPGVAQLGTLPEESEGASASQYSEGSSYSPPSEMSENMSSAILNSMVEGIGGQFGTFQLQQRAGAPSPSSSVQGQFSEQNSGQSSPARGRSTRRGTYER